MLTENHSYLELRQRELRKRVVEARDALDLLTGPAQRYRRVMRTGIVGAVVGGTGVSTGLVFLVLSAWIDFGTHVIPLLLVLSTVILVVAWTSLVVYHGNAREKKTNLTPPDRAARARRAFDEAYASYLATDPSDPADVYLEPIRR